MGRGNRGRGRGDHPEEEEEMYDEEMEVNTKSLDPLPGNRGGERTSSFSPAGLRGRASSRLAKGARVSFAVLR